MQTIFTITDGTSIAQLIAALGLPERAISDNGPLVLFNWEGEQHAGLGAHGLVLTGLKRNFGEVDDERQLVSIEVQGRPWANSARFSALVTAAESPLGRALVLARVALEQGSTAWEQLINMLDDSHPLHVARDMAFWGAVLDIVEPGWSALADDAHLARHFSTSAVPERGAVAVVSSENGGSLPLYPGLWLVVAGTGQGKTSLIEGSTLIARDLSLLGRLPAELIRFGEPAAQQDAYTVLGLIHRMQESIEAGVRFIIVDSMKQLLISSSNLGPGGISRAIQKEFTTLGASCAARGVTLIFTVNPLGLREEDEPGFLTAMEAIAEVIFTPRPVGGSLAVGIRSRRGGVRGERIFNAQVREGWLA